MNFNNGELTPDYFHEDEYNDICLGPSRVVRGYSSTLLDFDRWSVELRGAVRKYKVDMVMDGFGNLLDVDDYIMSEHGLVQKFIYDQATTD